MKPLPICYCLRSRFARMAHVHVQHGVFLPTETEYTAELRRLRRYERAVVRYAKDDLWLGGPSQLRRLAAESRKRSKR